MRKPQTTPIEPMPLLPPLPGWVTVTLDETLAVAAFQSGAALAHLSMATATDHVPMALWRDRLALEAAEVCVRLAGRREGASAIRDALHLAKAGDDPGPAGRIFRQWSRGVARPISAAGLAHALEAVTPERIALCFNAAGATPVERAAQVIEAVLADNPQGETTALILADAMMAKSLGWTHVLPLLGLRVTPRDLRLRGDDLHLACHRAAVRGVAQALAVAGALARAAARLHAVEPRLRAKGAAKAVEMFLSQDAAAPVALARAQPDSLSERAARRLCERLVELGALRELTGRDTFRLYGV